jgi:hypothetical protein
VKFRTWFKLWIAAFFQILSFGRRGYKSENQIKRERERALKTRRANQHRYYWGEPPKKRHKRANQNLKLATKLISFFALTLGILFLPFGVFDWGYKSVQQKKKSKTKQHAKSVVNPKKTAGARTSVRRNSGSQPNQITHSVSTEDVLSAPRQAQILPPISQKQEIEEIKEYKLSVLKEGEKDVDAVVQDEMQSLRAVWQENVGRFFAEHLALLQAGKAQMHTVRNIAVSKGRITADVFGERKMPYKVIITIEPVAQPCGAYLSIRDTFPTKKDFWLFCNCGEQVCAHIFAVLYAVGETFEKDEGIFYRLRGIECD